MLQISALGICFMTMAFAGSAVPAPGDVVWHLDSARSNVTLSVSNLLIAKIRGTMPFASARVVTANRSTVPLHVDALLDAASLNTRDPQRDADLRSDRFFDVARYPTIAFASEKILDTNTRSFTIRGELTMRGVTRPLMLDGHLAALTTEPDGKRRVRYECAGRFRRSDYGMTYARGIVGNDVTLNVVIEAVD